MKFACRSTLEARASFDNIDTSSREIEASTSLAESTLLDKCVEDFPLSILDDSGISLGCELTFLSFSSFSSSVTSESVSGSDDEISAADLNIDMLVIGDR